MQFKLNFALLIAFIPFGSCGTNSLTAWEDALEAAKKTGNQNLISQSQKALDFAREIFAQKKWRLEHSHRDLKSRKSLKLAEEKEQFFSNAQNTECLSTRFLPSELLNSSNKTIVPSPNE